MQLTGLFPHWPQLCFLVSKLSHVGGQCPPHSCSRRWLKGCFHLEMDRLFPSQLPALGKQRKAEALFTIPQQAARSEQNNKVWPSESANIDPAEMCLAAGALQTSHLSLCAWKKKKKGHQNVNVEFSFGGL